MTKTGATEEARTAPPPEELTTDLERLRGLVEQSDVEGARSYVKELEQRWPDSEAVRHWARVLAPPVARVVKGVPPRSLAKERVWLKEHGKEYPGCWLAVLEDRLIAADPELRIVLQVMHQTPGAEDALLHYRPGKPD